MKIIAKDCPQQYDDCIVFCNGRHYKEVAEINYFNNSLLTFKRDKKCKLVITESDNIKKVRVYGKIKVFFKEQK